MSTLLQRCQAVTEKVQQLAFAQRHATQERQVQERTREWKSRNDRLKEVQARVACLPLLADASETLSERRAALRHNASQALDRLKSLDNIAQLRDDACWERVLASVEGLTEELEIAGKAAWKAHIEELGAIEDPAWLRDRAPATPMNDAALAAFRAHHGVYAELTRLPMPRSSNDVVRLREVIAACQAEVAKITFDVPADVQRFFQDIQTGSATLASLTVGVLQWLEEHQQLERYRIRSAGQ